MYHSRDSLEYMHVGPAYSMGHLENVQLVNPDERIDHIQHCH
jgi:hypothetical protein